MAIRAVQAESLPDQTSLKLLEQPVAGSETTNKQY
jgi:hypothetical protein